jgi:hypothetical protein
MVRSEEYSPFGFSDAAGMCRRSLFFRDATVLEILPSIERSYRQFNSAP